MATRKFVVAHELGHYLSAKLGGKHSQKGYPKGEDSDNIFCNCTHVTSANQAHCLQSREHASDGEEEGWGHFVASDIMNADVLGNCVFNYYKEFRYWDGSPAGTIGSPPIWTNCAHSHLWMESFCEADAPNGGIEIDWLSFYWQLHNGVPSFSYHNMNLARGVNVFHPVWQDFQNNADAEFGELSDLAQRWRQAGEDNGIDH